MKISSLVLATLLCAAALPIASAAQEDAPAAADAPPAAGAPPRAAAAKPAKGKKKPAEPALFSLAMGDDGVPLELRKRQREGRVGVPVPQPVTPSLAPKGLTGLPQPGKASSKLTKYPPIPKGPDDPNAVVPAMIGATPVRRQPAKKAEPAPAPASDDPAAAH
jgi:hypothetical protein